MDGGWLVGVSLGESVGLEHCGGGSEGVGWVVKITSLQGAYRCCVVGVGSINGF